MKEGVENKMPDKGILSNQEQEQLVKLFDDIKLDLTVTDFPTRTNRLEAVNNMAKVLKIHGWLVIEDPEITESPSKSQREETAEEISSDKHQGRENY